MGTDWCSEIKWTYLMDIRFASVKVLDRHSGYYKKKTDFLSIVWISAEAVCIHLILMLLKKKAWIHLFYSVPLVDVLTKMSHHWQI